MNTHELAWAAGLIDGEGHIRADLHSRSTTTLAARLSVTQRERYVLDRFCRAVGRGRVYGPYGPARSKSGGRPKHEYIAVGFEPVQAIVAMLWRWLSPVKRAQATAALRSVIFMSRLAPGQPKTRSHCKNGHERIPENMHVFVGREGYTYRQCRLCNNEKMARSRARKRMAAALLEA